MTLIGPFIKKKSYPDHRHLATGVKFELPYNHHKLQIVYIKIFLNPTSKYFPRLASINIQSLQLNKCDFNFKSVSKFLAKIIIQT